MRTLLVTGGAGFIGANFVRLVRGRSRARVVNLDKLTYAGNLDSLAAVANDPDHVFIRGDIADVELVARLLAEHRPDALVNFAAESHVDRSIVDAAPFIQTNVVGTERLLFAAREHWRGLEPSAGEAFRFLHVSTDEVYGSLGPHEPAFREDSPYAPNSPYAASKAASDHLVRAYHHTYGLPAVITNCSNNYGPLQFPEKLIPLMICAAAEGRPLPVYGDGLQVRDWLYVEDHCEALLAVAERGAPGETYNIGGGCERTNLEVVRGICTILDETDPADAPHAGLIRFVEDRPGHDRRYAIDDRKIRGRLGWAPRESFESGLRRTVRWYLENRDWLERVRTGAYREWLTTNYAGRLGADPGRPAAPEGGQQP